VIQLVVQSNRMPANFKYHPKCPNKQSVVFAAGGWVRDKLMGQDSDDIDFVVPNGMVELFTDNLEYDIKQSLEQHHGKMVEWDSTLPRTIIDGKSNLMLKRINMTINRGEPDERFLKLDFRELGPNESIEDDTKRRDFRMNSIFFDVFENKIIDLVSVNLTP
jgi:tRNA nucleotidyltransferase/poly(A) polymerase